MIDTSSDCSDVDIDIKFDNAMNHLDEISKKSTGKQIILDGLKKRKKELVKMLKAGITKKQVIEVLRGNGIFVNLRDLSSILNSSRKSTRRDSGQMPLNHLDGEIKKDADL